MPADSKRHRSWSIRPVTRADAAEWLRLRAALWPDVGSTDHLTEIARFLGGQPIGIAAVLVAATPERRLVGMAELSIRAYAEGCRTDRVGFLEGWFVDPHMRFRGVGRALVAAAEDWARDQGCTEFASDALVDNEVSAAAHRALGFEETEVIRCFRKDLGGLPPEPAPIPAVAGTVKALAFDVFGTVVDWRTGIIEAGKALGQARGITADWTSLADRWRAGYGPSMDRVRSRASPWTKLDRLHRLTLDSLLPEFGLESLEEADKAELVLAWHRLPPWPDSAAGLIRLKRRFTIVTLSNGNVSLLTELARTGRLPFDAILSAELVRHYKPDAEAYRSVPEFLDLSPKEVMMVAAHPVDLDAAALVGLRTAYVHRPLEWGPDHEAGPVSVDRFDVISQDLEDLARQLGA